MKTSFRPYSWSSLIAAMCLLVIAGPLSTSAIAQGPVAPLTASRVKKLVRLKVVLPEGKPTSIKYTLDRSTDFNDLQAKELFQASGPIVVTARNFNPLSWSAAVTVNDLPDPAATTIGKLVEQLIATSTVLGAQIGTTADDKSVDAMVNALMKISSVNPAGCSAPAQAQAAATALYTALQSPVWTAANMSKRVEAWIGLVDTSLSEHGGPQALRDGADAIHSFLGDQGKKSDGSESITFSEAVGNLAAAVKTIQDALDKKDPTACDESARPSYVMMALTNPGTRLQEVTDLQKQVSRLETLLGSAAKNWLDADSHEYILKDSVQPTTSTMKAVQVVFTPVKYSFASPDPASSAAGATAEFVIRNYEAWVPEIGVGVTWAWVQRPTFGTGKNDAGDTVITQGQSSGANVDPTLMMNFVCGFCGASGFTPMFQVGTSTSKTTPAVFLGGGGRFLATSKGDFAIGIGFVLPWAQQLKSGVAPGKVVSGTADLQDNLEWRRLKGTYTYFTLQYKFGG